MSETAEKIKVMQAFLDGEEIVVTSGTVTWVVSNANESEPEWDWNSWDYRIKNYTLDIPWGLIDDSFQWAAMDSDGGIFFYVNKPTKALFEWRGAYPCVKSILKIKTPSTKHWEETLTRRPEGV